MCVTWACPWAAPKNERLLTEDERIPGETQLRSLTSRHVMKVPILADPENRRLILSPQFGPEPSPFTRYVN